MRKHFEHLYSALSALEQRTSALEQRTGRTGCRLGTKSNASSGGHGEDRDDGLSPWGARMKWLEGFLATYFYDKNLESLGESINSDYKRVYKYDFEANDLDDVAAILMFVDGEDKKKKVGHLLKQFCENTRQNAALGDDF